MFRSIKLRDYMLAHPVRISADANLFEAIKLITDNKISGLCVVDENNVLVGILSELDCLRAILSATYNDSGVGAVREYMTRDNLVVASTEDNIIELAQDMLQHKHRRRPVVEDGKLVGQITCRQLLIAVRSFKT
jgi:CBS domain-containing protein